jgi:hypothetical protein
MKTLITVLLLAMFGMTMILGCHAEGDVGHGASNVSVAH